MIGSRLTSTNNLMKQLARSCTKIGGLIHIEPMVSMVYCSISLEDAQSRRTTANNVHSSGILKVPII